MQDGCWHFHLFGANFATEVEAHKYVFEQWGIEPSESGSEAEYVSWGDRNPTWRIAEDLGFNMDSDFVELASTPEDVASAGSTEDVDSGIQQSLEKVWTKGRFLRRQSECFFEVVFLQGIHDAHRQFHQNRQKVSGKERAVFHAFVKTGRTRG